MDSFVLRTRIGDHLEVSRLVGMKETPEIQFSGVSLCLDLRSGDYPLGQGSKVKVP